MLGWALVPLASQGCDYEGTFDPGRLEASETRPELPEPAGAPTPYNGNNAIVTAAQTRLYDGFALHANVIYPTCGPINGVCHNAKEYPDLHTPANFLGAVDAPCNVQPGSHEAVFDRCEREGDRLDLGRGQPLEVAYIEYVAGDGDNAGDDEAQPSTPGLHIFLAGEVQLSERDQNREFWSEARFLRTFVDEDGKVEELPFFTYASRYRRVAETPYEFGDGQRGTHLVAEVRNYQTRRIEQLLAGGVQQADMNRNGILGARGEGHVRMIVPGDPESSYLVARLLGTMGDERIPGSRMPLANEPLDGVEMLGLFCFIEGLAEVQGVPDLSRPIDYAGCSYSQRPEDLELLGSGVSWDGRIARILEFNCGGCHGGEDPAADLNLKDGDVHARLLEVSNQRPELKLVEPGQPDMSYLLMKLEADPSIVGAPMPIDPLDGNRRLMPQELADVRAWIGEGALPGTMEPEPAVPPTPAPQQPPSPPPSDAGQAPPDAGTPMDAGPQPDAG